MKKNPESCAFPPSTLARQYTRKFGDNGALRIALKMHHMASNPEEKNYYADMICLLGNDVRRNPSRQEFAAIRKAAKGMKVIPINSVIRTLHASEAKARACRDEIYKQTGKYFHDLDDMRDFLQRTAEGMRVKKAHQNIRLIK